MVSFPLDSFGLNSSAPTFSQLDAEYDSSVNAAWVFMRGTPRPCFTPDLLSELNAYQAHITRGITREPSRYQYMISASRVEGVFNLGGDLELFASLIKQGSRDALYTYARSCIDILYKNMRHYYSDLTTISLVQGDALGGGFEAALSSNVLIAERGCKLGLPEVVFNLFPGMGAYSFLSRKTNPKTAEEIILRGKLYCAEELYEMGVIDILAEPGQGYNEVYNYIAQQKKSPNTRKILRKVKDICNPITYEELINITAVWSDEALQLTPKDLRMVDRLIKAQNNKHS